MQAPQQPGRRPTRHRAARLWLLAGGWLLFGLGVVGIFLPLLPTTVFWIGAVWCWTRSDPRLSRRILSHPRFGLPVRRFIEQGEMSRAGKWLALTGMTSGFLLLQWSGRPGWLLSLLLALCLLLVAFWLWRRPEPQAQRLAPDPKG